MDLGNTNSTTYTILCFWFNPNMLCPNMFVPDTPLSYKYKCGLNDFL